MTTNRNTVASCLHLVLCTHGRADCAATAVAGDSVLFLADGVMSLLNDEADCFDDGVELMYSRIDVRARGLETLASRNGVQQLEDDGLAPLLNEHGHCLSWN